ncbi:MAG TPA: Calx-beta domain-containing protein, partial [Verrucomicrobiota bacterium]|nr:Calx-beta domain-containing protein [Verrucomicrobiota bacterium]
RTAAAGADYTETKGTLTFAAGEMARSITVPLLESGAAQPDRQFKVVLSNPTSGMLLGPSSNLTATVTVFETREMSRHQFDVCQVSSSGTLTLTLGGGFTPGLGLSNRFQPYYDIYPLEVSSNLTDWAPLTWVVRTSALTNPLSCVDTKAQFDSQRFYRTPAATFVTPQRAPSGPYPVGVTDRTIRDDNRRNRYRISTNGSFPITIWYPARRIPGQWPTAYEPAPGTRDPRVWPGWTDRAPYFRSHSLSNAPFASGLRGLPVALWSHGYPDRRYDGQEWAEHLASHGYVVVAVDHADSSVVVYPDGRYIFTDFNDLTGRDLSDQLRQDRVRDFVVVLDEMAGWNERDNLFAGRIDVQNAAAIGWSYGGGVAAEFCRVDSRPKAAVVLEGYFQNVETLLAAGLTKPVLSMYQASSSDARLFNKLTQDAVWFQIRYAEHPNFCGDYWCFASTTLERSREAARTITDYMLWFLNKYLKGSQNPMPDPAAYPQVFNFKRK